MNIQTYWQLRHFAGFTSEAQAQQDRLSLEGRAMPIILASPLQNPDDLVRMIHMVYAWMPKMLRSFNENIEATDLGELFRLARRARRSTITEKEENLLFEKLAYLTNYYMVGASKVLTILNHEVYPIFDSRVVASWNSFFNSRPQWHINNLYNYRVNQPELMIQNYRYYMHTLRVWSSNTGKMVRELEFLFWKAR